MRLSHGYQLLLPSLAQSQPTSTTTLSMLTTVLLQVLPAQAMQRLANPMPT
jgi:hypothetical protein